MRVKGNTALITGGATGIGYALARALVDLDNEVIICGRRREVLREAKSPLNILVNNAGVQHSVGFTKGARDLEETSAEIATNLVGPLELSAMLIPHLRRRKESAIVNITSGLAFTPLAAVPVCCATKAGLHSLSMSMRRQLRDTPIRLFEVAPPTVSTDLGGRRRHRDEVAWCMSAEDAASGIVEALENDRLEVALGGAAHLRTKRDVAFDDMNA